MLPLKDDFGCILLYFSDESRCHGRLGESGYWQMFKWEVSRFAEILFWMNLIFTCFYWCTEFLSIPINSSPPTHVHILNIFYCSNVKLLLSVNTFSSFGFERKFSGFERKISDRHFIFYFGTETFYAEMTY